MHPRQNLYSARLMQALRQDCHSWVPDLRVVCLADTQPEAEQLSEQHIRRLGDSEKRLAHRCDIAPPRLSAAHRPHGYSPAPSQIGSSGSTRGTDLQYLIEAIANHALPAEITLVVSTGKRRESSAVPRPMAFQPSTPLIGKSATAAGAPDINPFFSARVDLIPSSANAILSPASAPPGKIVWWNVHPSCFPILPGHGYRCACRGHQQHARWR